ncbi:hypothetical protein [Pseudanabaena minima]|uniref:hypothetical protein n=1 Tax=Pseudanabaena minima TaxID=890415 RepID=UPI003DAA1334
MMKKIIQAFKQLTFAEQATLAATWLQTIAVVLGIAVAVFQLQAALQQTNQGQRKESIALIEQFNRNVAPYYQYLEKIHKDISNISEESSVNKQKIMLEQVSQEIDRKKIEKAYSELDNFYENASTCYRTEVCSKEIIGGFICERSEDFLNLGRYPEKKKQIKDIYVKFYTLMNQGDSSLRLVLDDVITTHVGNAQRMCPLFVRMKYEKL